jgi:hypothetical protein
MFSISHWSHGVGIRPLASLLGIKIINTERARSRMTPRGFAEGDKTKGCENGDQMEASQVPMSEHWIEIRLAMDRSRQRVVGGGVCLIGVLAGQIRPNQLQVPLPVLYEVTFE